MAPDDIVPHLPAIASFPSAADRLRQLGGRSAIGAQYNLGGLESGGLDGEGPSLDVTRRARSLEQLEAVLRYDVVENPASALDKDATDRFLDMAREALARLAEDGANAELNMAHHVGLEAVIETDGSLPSIPFQDGTLDPDNPRLGDWKQDVISYRSAIDRAACATSRLVQGCELSDLKVLGTAFMIAPSLAATAKHVVEAIASEQQGEWTLNRDDYVLDFAVEYNRDVRPDKRFKIRSVHWASPDLIDGKLDLANLDIAIIKLEEEGPPPLIDIKELKKIRCLPHIHVIGHPRRLLAGDLGLTPDFAEIMQLIFGDGFGVKRWSPGMILNSLASRRDEQTNQTVQVLTHTASTLGGNSGSPLLDFTKKADRLLGLHYGGFFGKENYAHFGQSFAAAIENAST